jgi:hypothetical protein
VVKVKGAERFQGGPDAVLTAVSEGNAVSAQPEFSRGELRWRRIGLGLAFALPVSELVDTDHQLLFS